MSEKSIIYSWDGGHNNIKIILKPGIDLSYISPNNSDGVFNQDLSNCDLIGCDMRSSYFYNCDFRNSNIKKVKMDNNMKLFGSDFRNAKGLTSYNISKIIQSGGMLTDEHVKEYLDFKKYKKKVSSLVIQQVREIKNINKKYKQKIKEEELNLESRFKTNEPTEILTGKH